MKSLFALMCTAVAIGFVASDGGEPGPDPEMPLCNHESCKKLRTPGETRPARGPSEDPAYRYRADTLPSGSIPRLSPAAKHY